MSAANPEPRHPGEAEGSVRQSPQLDQLRLRCDRNGVRWVLALVLSLRQGEALGLKWDDIDWRTGLLSVKRSRTRPRYQHCCQPYCGHKHAGHCPARRNVRPLTDTTKSRAGKRIVPLPGAIVDLLLAHREAQSVERQRAAQL